MKRLLFGLADHFHGYLSHSDICQMQKKKNNGFGQRPQIFFVAAAAVAH